MNRGIENWVDEIKVTRDEGSKQIKVEVSGLWNGKDRMVIANHLRKAMRKAKYDIVKAHKKADLEKQKIAGLKDEVVVSEKIANKNIKKEEKKKCPKTPKKKKLLMKQVKR